MSKKLLDWRELAEQGIRPGVRVIDQRKLNHDPQSLRRLGIVEDVVSSENIQVRWENEVGTFTAFERVTRQDINLYRDYIKQLRGL